MSMESLERLEELEDVLAAEEAVAEHQRGETLPLAQLIAEREEPGQELPD